MVGWAEMPRSPGHVFYDRLQSVLIEGGFDGFAEAACRSYYAARLGAPSVPPGRYFRMHLVGYFEGIDSERGLEWRCSDSLSLREFLRLESRDRVPDHSWLSRTRARLPHEVHTAIFDWVLALIAEAGLVKGERIRSMPRPWRPSGAAQHRAEGHGRGLPGDAGALGPGERHRDTHGRGPGAPGPQAQGQEALEPGWVSKSDPEAKIAKMKDGSDPSGLQARARGGSGHRRGGGRSSYTRPTRATRDAGEDAGGGQGASEGGGRGTDGRRPGRMCDRQGLSARSVLKPLDDGPWKTRISSPSRKVLRAGTATGRPAGQSPTTGPGCYRAWPRISAKLRAEIKSSAPAHNLDRGGMRRTWLRGRENVHKRYPAPCRRPQSQSPDAQTESAAGTPREAVASGCICVLIRQLEPFWSLRWSSSSRRMVQPPSSRYVSPSSETRLNERLFQRAASEVVQTPFPDSVRPVARRWRYWSPEYRPTCQRRIGAPMADVAQCP